MLAEISSSRVASGGLPVSATSRSASSPMCASRMSAARNRSAERSAGVVVRHDRNASRAAATASSTSAAPDSVGDVVAGAGGRVDQLAVSTVGCRHAATTNDVVIT